MMMMAVGDGLLLLAVVLAVVLIYCAVAAFVTWLLHKIGLLYE